MQRSANWKPIILVKIVLTALLKVMVSLKGLALNNNLVSQCSVRVLSTRIVVVESTLLCGRVTFHGVSIPFNAFLFKDLKAVKVNKSKPFIDPIKIDQNDFSMKNVQIFFKGLNFDQRYKFLIHFQWMDLKLLHGLTLSSACS